MSTPTSPRRDYMAHLVHRAQSPLVICEICQPDLLPLSASTEPLSDTSNGFPFTQNFPRLFQILYHLQRHYPIMDTGDVEEILRAFIHVAFDALDAYQYIKPWIPAESRQSNRDIHWAMGYAEENFRILYATTPTYLHDFIDEIDAPATFVWIYECMLPEWHNEEADGAMYLGWYLAKSLYETATHPATPGCELSKEIFERWAPAGGAGFLGGKAAWFRPRCYDEGIPWATIEADEDAPNDLDSDDASGWEDDDDDSSLFGAPDAYANDMAYVGDEDGEWQEDFDADDVVVKYAAVDINPHTEPHTSAAGEPKSQCTICQEEEEQDGFVALNLCGHIFHGECFGTWANTSCSTATCPLCRKVVCEKETLPVSEGPEPPPSTSAPEQPAPGDPSPTSDRVTLHGIVYHRAGIINAVNETLRFEVNRLRNIVAQGTLEDDPTEARINQLDRVGATSRWICLMIRWFNNGTEEQRFSSFTNLRDALGEPEDDTETMQLFRGLEGRSRVGDGAGVDGDDDGRGAVR